MNSYVSLHLLRTTLEDLRNEISSKSSKQGKEYARELVTNERAIAALQKEFRATDKGTDSRIRELNKTLKLVIDASDRRREDIKKLEREVDRLVRMDREKENRIRELERRSRYWWILNILLLAARKSNLLRLYLVIK